MDPEGKVALITGGARRLGRSLVMALAERGCGVVIHYYRSADAAEDTAQRARSLGVRAEIIKADLRQPDAVQSLFATIDRVAGPLDILVHSAAIMHEGDFLALTTQDWEHTMGLNLRAAFLCLQQAGRRMKTNGRGSIVALSDVAGSRPWRRYPLHSVSKAGLEMLVRVAARSLAPEVRVNAVAPGPILRSDGISADRWRRLAEALPAGRAGRPQEVAQAVLFLIENDYVTGEVLHVDGGRTLI